MPINTNDKDAKISPLVLVLNWKINHLKHIRLPAKTFHSPRRLYEILQEKRLNVDILIYTQAFVQNSYTNSAFCG
jgi:hypothetical protein